MSLSPADKGTALSSQSPGKGMGIPTPVFKPVGCSVQLHF